ncbi:RNA polymerase sigma factor WhiG [soil metagenome]
MRPHTIGRLWGRYLEARSKLDTDARTPDKKRALSLEAEQLRERLVINYSPLVKYVAGRVSARMTGAIDREDFLSSGLIGLLNAIETYDPGREVKFETYAISKIRWAILDEARKEDALPRRTRSRSRQIDTARRELTQQLQREPTEAELAEKSALSISDYRSVVQQQNRAKTRALETGTSEEEGQLPGPQIADQEAIDPENAIEQVERQDELISAMRELTEKERTVVTLYFYEDLTLREIGQALGLTEGRISQILKNTLGKLRWFISDDQSAPGLFV